jgi:transcriptional regulator with XRE-family HTH domain
MKRNKSDPPWVIAVRQAVAKDARPRTALAKAAGVHPGTLAAFLRGRSPQTIGRVERFAEAVGLTLTLVPIRD